MTSYGYVSEIAIRIASEEVTFSKRLKTQIFAVVPVVRYV